MTEEYAKNIDRLLAERQERLKELSCINTTTGILKQGKPVEESLTQIVLILPRAMQFPENSFACIQFDNKIYKSEGFLASECKLSQNFETVDGKFGVIELYYDKSFPLAFEGPFLKEERDLINNLADIISGYINSIIGKNLYKNKKEESKEDGIDSDEITDISSRQLLQRFIGKHNTDRDVYHDLMPFKVKEILLVANLYDAYIIEKEGRFLEYILGEYHQLNLTSMPRITGVSTPEEALAKLQKKHFDLVIIMMGVDKKTPVKLSKLIREKHSYVPVYLLLNNNQDIGVFEQFPEKLVNFDRIFVWNGDSKIFFAMIKHLEDRVNLENDTQKGMVRVILLVEDSAKYYSRYLPILYKIVLEQTKRLIEDVSTDELYKVLKLRARPKILHALDYEEAISIFDKYRDNILCVISDVRYPKGGIMNERAGFDLISYIKQQNDTIPTVIQSSDEKNANVAYKLKSSFINKNSDALAQEIRSFITFFLGFGSFVFRDQNNNQLAVAKSLKEFEQQLKIVPDESVIYHAMKNHFSIWLMAHGEIQIAKVINPVKVADFKNPADIRNYILNVIHKFRYNQDKGKIVQFSEEAVLDESNIVSLSSGALGGKGRGLTFVNSLIYNFDFSRLVSDIHIRTPRTSIIGTDEFDMFLEKNNLYKTIYNERDYLKIKTVFLEGELSYNLVKRLKVFLKLINKPLAIRSSSLFEDSLMQPFSGIFATYLLPNNHPDLNVRLKQAMDAIKLVYASIYSPDSRRYFEAINYKIEEEKMAIVIQDVVGNQYDQYFYPHISGTAQSHNYYPVAHMKPEEGFAVAAVGLGMYVVEGEKTFRFSPKYPQLEINSPKDQFKGSQVEFFAIDLRKQNLNLLEGEEAGLSKLDISVAENHGTIKHSASVFDKDNERIIPGIETAGPRIINFSNILKYNYAPLAQTLTTTLDLVKEALGSPVEIEYAVDLNKDKNGLPSFYLLQIKPLVGNDEDYNIDLEKIDKNQVLLYAEKSMGNGKIDNLTDIVYVEPGAFDNMKTLEMTHEIEKINEMMMRENRKYVLIGPGRWGTRDRFIGIPVVWPQICNAKIIVEMSLEDFPLDASLGSHFFHNVTSMNVGYFSIQHSLSGNFINWKILNQQKLIYKTEYFKHVRFQNPFDVIMDGKKRISLIVWKND